MRYLRLSPVLKQSTERWLTWPVSRLGQVSYEDSEGLLEQEKDHITSLSRERWRVFSLTKPRRYIALGGIATLLLLFLAYAFSNRPQAHGEPTDARERNSQRLHLAIPTPDLNNELCKTVLSSEVLHYSTPTLVHWEFDPDQNARESAQRRMTTVRDYLDKLLEYHENDTVVLLGSASTWFQLRPEVLLKRYYEINREGNQRLLASKGLEKMQEMSVEQSVVFSASSDCGVASGDAVKCSRLPKSPSKGKIAAMNPPRYLSQDVVIGKVKDVHEIYRRAVAIVEQDQEFTSELAIFSEIFASQEHHRSLIIPKTLSWSQRFRGLFTSSYSHGPLAAKNATTLPKRHADEFGIGLDYAGALSTSTSKGPESFMLTQQMNLPPDVSSSMPPFWTTTGQGLPSHRTWSDLDLFTNVYTYSVPAVVHNNIADDPDVRQKQWGRLWLQPFSRKLLDAYVNVPVMPLAAVVDNEGVEQVFWSTTTGEKAGAKDADGKWYGWDELCGGEDLAAELFGDDLGEWKAARS
jgi:uracil-DNA glycosylase